MRRLALEHGARGEPRDADAAVVPAFAAARGVEAAVERAGGDGERRFLDIGDLDHLPEAAAELARTSGIGEEFLAPEHQRRLALGDLDRDRADAAGEGRGREPVLAWPRAGAAEPDIE